MFTESTDAMGWAEAFVEHKQRNNWSIDEIDADLMVSWFANAMMRMSDSKQAENERLKKEKLYEEARHGQTGIAFSLYREEVVAEVDRLREALRKYGHHVGGCDGCPCKCGILKALETEIPTTPRGEEE